MITTEKIEKLRRLAEAVRLKVWVYDEYFGKVETAERTKVHESCDIRAGRFSAAADPATVLALLDRLAELEAENERLSDQLKSARRYIEGRWRVDD